MTGDRPAFYLGAKCYRWGTFCAQPFDDLDAAMSAVSRPGDASAWFVVEWQGSKMVGEVARLDGNGKWEVRHG